MNAPRVLALVSACVVASAAVGVLGALQSAVRGEPAVGLVQDAGSSPRDGAPAAADASSQGTIESPTPAPAFDEKTKKRILTHSPLPPLPPDPTNKFADDPRAAELGRRFFYEKRFSKNGELSCASCHDPAKSFADGRQLAQGVGTTTRHAPSLWNAAWQRWYFWDGRADTLWAQALKPLEHADELASNRARVAHAIACDPVLAREYAAIFGPLPGLSDAARFPADARPMTETPERSEARAWSAMTEADRAAVDRVFANAGKAIAAFERRIASRDSPFDRFAAALRAGDEEAQAAYPAAARRGLALFAGKANCRSCHAGANFTDGEFHNIGVPTLDRTPSRDAGRHAGFDALAADPFNAAGAFSDDPAGERARELAAIARSNEHWGQFKTPTLRNVARTAPYMHQGQFATLRDVLRYYSTLEGSVPAGHHGEQVIRPLHLSEGEIDDLVAFLESLTDESALAGLGPPADARSAR